MHNTAYGSRTNQNQKVSFGGAAGQSHSLFPSHRLNQYNQNDNQNVAAFIQVHDDYQNLQNGHQTNPDYASSPSQGVLLEGDFVQRMTRPLEITNKMC